MTVDPIQRREAIRAAILDLKPVNHQAIKQAIDDIDSDLSWVADAISNGRSRPVPPTYAAAQLRDLAGTLRKAIKIADELSAPGTLEIENVRQQRRIRWDIDERRNTWASLSGALLSSGAQIAAQPYYPLTSGDLYWTLDAYYPDFLSVLDEAADNLNRLNTGGRPKGSDEVPTEISETLAKLFHKLTGRAPSHSRSETRFSSFVAAIFVLAGVPETRVIHYASVAARNYKNRMRESP